MKRTGAGIAVRRGAEVLLVHRRDDGQWDVPGGGSEGHEAPEDTARRELREETGLTVGEVRPLGVWRHRYTYPDGNVVDWTTHVFTAAYAGGEARASDDAARVEWWPLSALPQDVSETTAKYFAALRAQEPA
ncbi:NUDIX domain-containing protein [Deinococcus sp. PESE-13]